MTLRAPRAARAGIANPVTKVLPGRTMGGGSQGKAMDVQYAHAVPPSENTGRVGFAQRAYFSALRMVFVVPSVMSSRRTFPWGRSLSAPELRTASRALPA